MAGARWKELSGLSATELSDKLLELRLSLLRENAQIAAGTTPKNPGIVRQTKKAIARVSMLRDQRESAALTQSKQGAESKKGGKLKNE